MNYRYDRNTGDFPRINDIVEICHTQSDLDGRIAKVTGIFSPYEMNAILHFDEPINTQGATGLTISVVCLRKLGV